MNVYVRDLARHLGQIGVHVDVFTRSQDEHVPHVLHDLGYGNRVVHVPAGPEIPLPKQELLRFLPDFVRGIQDFSASKSQKYDLIHSHYWMSGIAARTLKEEWNLPVVHMFHTLGMMKQRVAKTMGDQEESEYRLAGEREVLQVADKIVAATPAELAQLQWLYQADPKKIVIIPPGVDLSRFYPIPTDEAKEFIGVPPRHRILLFVGRIEPLKGLDTLLEAIANMRREGLIDQHSIYLSVIGGDPEVDPQDMNVEMARVQELSAEFGLDDMVTFLGQGSQDTLPYYYSAAEAVIVPSHYESFGMVALEAMACGTPVVASQVGGLAFLVQDKSTGYTVPTSDPKALADRLIAIINDSDLRQQMGKQASEFARAYDWRLISARVVNLYDELLRD